MNDIIIAAIIGTGGALLGGIMGIYGTLIITDRTTRLEERKHFRELGLKVAIINHDKNAAMAQQLANQTGRTVETPPLEVFVIKGMKFMDIVATPNINAAETARRLTLLQDFTSTVIHASKEK